MYPQTAICLRANDTLNLNMTQLISQSDEHFNLTAAGFTVITIEQPLNSTPLPCTPHNVSSHKKMKHHAMMSPYQQQQQQCIRSPIPFGTRLSSGTQFSPISDTLPLHESQYEYKQWLDNDHTIRALWRCDFSVNDINGHHDDDIIIITQTLLPTRHTYGHARHLLSTTSSSSSSDDTKDKHSAKDDDYSDDDNEDSNDNSNNDMDMDHDTTSDNDEWFHKLIRHRIRSLSPANLRNITIRFGSPSSASPTPLPSSTRQRQVKCAVATFAIQVKSKGVIELGVKAPTDGILYSLRYAYAFARILSLLWGE
jgi:hypothetical protein